MDNGYRLPEFHGYGRQIRFADGAIMEESNSSTDSELENENSASESSSVFSGGNDTTQEQQKDNTVPEGSECVMYLTRDILCSAKRDFDHGLLSPLYGEIRGEHEYLLLNFKLLRRFSRKVFFDLEITDVSFERHLTLARFQQAEIVLEFFKLGVEGNEKKLIHAEPPFMLSLDLTNLKCPNGTRKPFAVYCEDVIPIEKLREAMKKQDGPCRIMIRIYLKLIQGKLDILHGIQKCFHPDKSLYDLRDMLENSLLVAEDTDVILVSGDNIGFKAHRSILSANSNVFKAMMKSGLSESKTGVVNTPDISGKVLEKLLKYMYSRNRKDLEDDPGLTYSVMRAAHFYEMNLLVELCEESLLAMPKELFTMETCLCIFEFAELLDRPATKTKIIHVLLGLDVKLSSSTKYIAFLRRAPATAAKMTELIIQFKNFQK